jgi:hypothetical protein
VPDYLIKGKIIDNNNEPASGLQVKAYAHDLKFTDHTVGQATTATDGTFDIKF